MHLDDVLPTWHYRERHQIAVAATPAAVLEAIDDLRWREVPVFRALLTVRGLGRGAKGEGRVLDQFTDMGFTELARAREELVAGAICDWKMGPALPLGEEPTEAFRAFQQPGHVKIVLNFRHQSGVLTSETRVWATDERSRKRFGPYWFAVRIGGGVIRHVWLRAIRHRAQNPTP